MAFAETTRPSSSINTCTLTVPWTPTANACGGYGGVCRLIARPLITPSDLIGGGPGFRAGGGSVDSTDFTAFAISSAKPVAFSEPPDPGPIPVPRTFDP